LDKDGETVTTHTLSPGEIERLLQHDFGNKLQPIDIKRLAKRQRVQDIVTAHKTRMANCAEFSVTKP
jgi:hypothetical protein